MKRFIQSVKYYMGFYYAGPRVPIGLWCLRNSFWNTQEFTKDRQILRNIQLWSYHLLSYLCDIRFYKEYNFAPGGSRAWSSDKKFLGIPYI